jgi:long-chain fatty acid transport protein
MSWLWLLLPPLATVAISDGPAQASGFLIYDLSGQALGRASAVSASVDEPAAVWFNPAALVYQPGVRASAGGIFVTAQSRFSPAAGGPETTTDRGNYILPTFFASARVAEQVAVAMGVYTAFGIGIQWPDGWPGQESAIAASLKTVAFNPTVSVKLHPRFSAAVGFDAVRAAVDFTNGLPALVGGTVRLGGGTWGYGANAGVLFQVEPELLHLALTYRSRIKLSFDGNADFRPANPDFEPSLPDQPGTASITLPDIITLGVMFRPRADLTLTFDTNFANPRTPDRAIVPNAHDAFTLRGGIEWAVNRWPGLRLRAGLIFDQRSINQADLGPGLPDANRLDGAIGAGYSMGHFKADLGYLLVYFLPADATSGREGPEGTYHTVAHLIGLTLAVSRP